MATYITQGQPFHAIKGMVANPQNLAKAAAEPDGKSRGQLFAVLLHSASMISSHNRGAKRRGYGFCAYCWRSVWWDIALKDVGRDDQIARHEGV